MLKAFLPCNYNYNFLKDNAYITMRHFNLFIKRDPHAYNQSSYYTFYNILPILHYYITHFTRHIYAYNKSSYDIFHKTILFFL